MGRIETRIKEAFEQYKKDGKLLPLVKEIADVGDKSVNCKYHAAIMYEALRDYCPKPVFECVYYDGENGEYHLFDFDPNSISRKSLLIEVRSRLEHEIGVELDYIDTAMKSVYLLDSNSLVKVVIE